MTPPRGPAKTPKKTPIQSKNAILAYYFLPRLNDPNIRFLKVRSHGKEAVESGWQLNQNYGYKSDEIRQWVERGDNYALTSPSGFFCLIDADYQEIQEVLDSKHPQTFRYSTGKLEHYQYAYFLEDAPIGCVPLAGGDT
ncbi:MAG: bifunctional DNA primase/polymerase [Thermoplasmatales archaeon]